MTLFGEEIVLDGQGLDVNVTGSIIGARLVRPIDGATSVELTLFDPEMALLRSGALTRQGKPSKGQKQFKEAAWDRFSRMRLTFDGISFRLAGGGFRYDPQTYEVTLTFEDELATLMRLQSKAIKVSRGQDTRAEFNRTLVRRALAGADVPFNRQISDRYFSPQAGQREAIKEPEEDERSKGFPKGKKFKIKTADADSDQKAVLTEALTEADRLKSGERAALALIVTLITEKECRNTPGGDADSSGAFQLQARTAAAAPSPAVVIDPRSGLPHGSVTPRVIAKGPLNPLDVTECTRYFLLHGFAAYQHGAIKYAADNPDAEIYEIAQAQQGSGAGRESNGQSNYGPWVEQAKTILDLWGGAGATHTIREAFEFRAGGRHNGTLSNYWDDSGDSADEVAWRRFADRNKVWFVPDEWLFERKQTIYWTGEDGPPGLASQGIISIDTTGFDIGLPAADIIVKCFLPRWGGAPGATVEIDDLGPLSGTWLIANNDMDLLPDPEVATLTLQRPQPKKKEPAPKTNTVQTTETLPEAGSVASGIVAMAKKAFSSTWRARYSYRSLRPYPATLFPADYVSLIEVDCSSFATLVYKAAGANDPNGAGFNGAANTGTMRANGKKTNDPHPGDLVFYTNPEHVAIYIGDGEAIGIGGRAGVRRHAVKDQPNRFLGYWSYDLGTGGTTGTTTPASTAPDNDGWHPDAQRVPMEDAGGFDSDAGWKIVHHTTEGGSISGAESAYRANRSSPHFTFDHDSGSLHQHIKITHAARALVHEGGTPETNRARAIQIEHVGFAASSGSWSNAAYDRIASLCRWIEENTGVPRSSSVSFSSPSRLSGSAFFSYEGHCGHVHVPGNDHTDPGTGFKIDRVI